MQRRFPSRSRARSCPAAFAAVVILTGVGLRAAAAAEEAEAAAGRDAPSNAEASSEEVTVTATPLARSVSELATPADVLEGKELRTQQEPTLGQTLTNQPGVASTYYGPNASRPVIRGQGGDHIRVLTNGLSLGDASAVSVDHAVGLDPIAVRQIDIVRGPGALLYGPSAVGGVVNALDNRIPDQPLEGVSVRLEPRWDSGSSEWGGAGLIEAGAGGFNLHLDGVGRNTSNVSIPGFARSAALRALDPLPPGEAEPKNRLPNSAAATQGGALGISYAWESGYIGVAPSWYHSNYGVVAEPNVKIDLELPRLDVAGRFDDVISHVNTLQYKLGLTDYEHTEFEGPEVGTVFKNRGWDGRVDVLHDTVGPFEGAVGFETVGFDFSALGEESFLPKTTNRLTSGFVFEEVRLDPVRLQFGARVDGSSSDAEADPAFGPAASRTFLTGSGSAGVVYEPYAHWPLGFSVNYSSRAPNYQELYADGPHIATAAFERGDRDLAVENSLGFDLSVRRTTGRISGFATLFYNRFDGYITLEPTMESFPFDDGSLQVFQYQGVPADFTGGEAGLTLELLPPGPVALDLELGADYVYTRDRDTGSGLPFIPPFRFRAGLTGTWKDLATVLQVIHAAEQDRLAPGGLPTSPTSIATPDYTLLNLFVTYRLRSGPVSWDLLLRGTNLTNAQAREATSFLKEIAPLPGVSFSGGLRVSF